MFSKEDYNEYFNLLLKFEKDMNDKLSAAISEIQDESITKILNIVLEDEKKHANLAEILLQLLADSSD